MPGERERERERGREGEGGREGGRDGGREGYAVLFFAMNDMWRFVLRTFFSKGYYLALSYD